MKPTPTINQLIVERNTKAGLPELVPYLNTLWHRGVMARIESMTIMDFARDIKRGPLSIRKYETAERFTFKMLRTYTDYFEIDRHALISHIYDKRIDFSEPYEQGFMVALKMIKSLPNEIEVTNIDPILISQFYKELKRHEDNILSKSKKWSS